MKGGVEVNEMGRINRNGKRFRMKLKETAKRVEGGGKWSK